jgi:tetratricopeptide (TPR) repeat protein
MDLRYQLAAGHFVVKDYESARQVIDEGIRRDPENQQFVQLKRRVCFEGELWECALEASGQQYDLDTTLVGSAEFYREVYALAIEVDDSTQMFKWSGEALKHFPDSKQWWQVRALLFDGIGATDSAIVAFEKLVALDSTDVRSTLRVAQARAERISIDSLTPLDTAALAELDGLLTRVVETRPDTGFAMAVGLEYLKIAQKLVQQQVDIDLGIAWADKAISYDWRAGQIATNSNFWRGYGFFYKATPLDQRIVESKSCNLIPQYERFLRSATQSLTDGRSVSPEIADQFLGYLQQLAGRPAQFREAFKCP